MTQNTVQNALKKLFLLLGCFFAFGVAQPIFAQTNKAWTSPNTLIKINKTRKLLGLKEIALNQQLCSLGMLAATRDEVAYPKQLLGTNDPALSSYRKGFSFTGASTTNVSDFIIKLDHLEGKAFMDERSLENFAEKGNQVSMYPDFTDGCVAVSPGGVGYKQFALFVGGVKEKPLTIFQYISRFFSTFFHSNENPFEKK